MNPNDSEFEEQLRALRPVAPAPALADSIAREMKPRGAAPTAAILPGHAARWLPGFLRGLGWAAAGACAAFAAIALFERAEPAAPTPTQAARIDGAGFEYAESTAELLAAEDEGFVYSGGEAPARRVRYSSIERHVWTDPGTGARMEVEIPREDIRLMPVTMQ